MCSLTDASLPPSRTPAHGSGSMWIATPSSYRTCTDYSLPVSRRTAKYSGHSRPAPIRHGRLFYSKAKDCAFVYNVRSGATVYLSNLLSGLARAEHRNFEFQGTEVDRGYSF